MSASPLAIGPGQYTIHAGPLSMSTNKPGQIYAKMSAVMRDVGAIGKDQKNTAQGFKFRGIDQFVNALYPALVKHGVFLSPRSVNYSQELKDVTRSNGKAGVDKHVTLMMEYTFYAEDGSCVTVGPVPAEGLDSGDKATNKALSAALKYALIQTFSIPTEDMAEADLDSPEIGVATSTPSTVESNTSEAAPAASTKKTSSFRKPAAKSAAPTSEETQEGGWE